MDNDNRLPEVGNTIEIENGQGWIPAAVIDPAPSHGRIRVRYRTRENRGGEIHWGWATMTLHATGPSWRWPNSATSRDPLSTRWLTETRATVTRYGFDPLSDPFKGLIADVLQAKLAEHHFLASALLRLLPHLSKEERRQLDIEELRKFVGTVNRSP
jgi:hypothetical protein